MYSSGERVRNFSWASCSKTFMEWKKTLVSGITSWPCLKIEFATSRSDKDLTPRC